MYIYMHMYMQCTGIYMYLSEEPAAIRLPSGDQLQRRRFCWGEGERRGEGGVEALYLMEIHVHSTLAKECK